MKTNPYRRVVPSAAVITSARLSLALTLAAALSVTSCSGTLPSPNSDMSVAEAMRDIGDALGQLREDNAFVLAQVDSLRGVVAYQDTIIRQLAAQANVPVRPSASSYP